LWPERHRCQAGDAYPKLARRAERVVRASLYKGHALCLIGIERPGGQQQVPCHRLTDDPGQRSEPIGPAWPKVVRSASEICSRAKRFAPGNRDHDGPQLSAHNAVARLLGQLDVQRVASLRTTNDGDTDMIRFVPVDRRVTPRRSVR
jgi:hypothetical protein